MVSLIFLGILWLKCNSGIREGLDPSASGDVAAMQALSTDILNDVNSRLMAGGIDTATITASLPGFIDQINDMVTKEAGVFTTTTAPVDLNTVIDTTERDKYPGKSFFTGSKFSAGFCPNNSDRTKGDQCKLLTTENCNQTDCCIVLNGSKCVSGNADGPDVKVDDKGRDIDYAYYSYKNECYGSCGKGLAGTANPCSGYSDEDTGISEACINRYWKGSTCPNPNYITPEVVASLQSMNKAQIQVLFKNLVTDEANYEKCYGPNEANWPAPCFGTSDGSQNLSGRCLKKLLENSGCVNTSLIDDAYVLANSAKSKSEMITTFARLNIGTDDESLAKCYGPDKLSWPEPCANVPDSARFYRDEIPLRCLQKLWTDNTECPSTDFVTDFYNSNIKNKTPDSKKDKYTKAVLIDDLKKGATAFQDNRFECFGANPNNWPTRLGITRVSPLTDDCKDLTPLMAVKDIPPGCKTRLTGVDIFPDTNCKGNKLNNKRTTFAAFSSNTTSLTSAISELSSLETSFKGFCPVPQITEFILGVGTNHNIYTKPTSDLTEAWTDRGGGLGGAFWSVVQLKDKTFLGLGTDLNIFTKASLDKKDSWQRIIRQPCCTGTVIQLTDGTFVAVGQDRKLYKRATLYFDDWSQIPDTGDVVNISLIKIGTSEVIVGINVYNQVYTRPATTNKETWTYQEKFGIVRAIIQLANGTYVGAGMDYKLYTKTTIDANWLLVPNSGDVYNISTINILA